MKYISQGSSVKIDTSLIKIGQEIAMLLLFEGFNMANIGTAIWIFNEISRSFKL